MSTTSQKRENCRVNTELLRNGDEEAEITSWRIFKILAEFVSGFELLRKYGLAATIYGSARISSDHPMYQEAQKLAGRLSKKGFTIITGGGGGVMEGANKGAYEAGGRSVGLNIKLPDEQHLNHYVTDFETFHYFFTRKVSLAFASEVYIYFPGGFGTLDEFFEMVTLIQTGKVERIPIVLVGSEYLSPLISWIRTTAYENKKYVGKDDLDIFYLAKDSDEAFDYIMRVVPLENETN